MTSQKSSGNKAAVKRGSVSRASMYSYVTGLTSCVLPAAGIFAVLTFIFTGLSASAFSNMKKIAEKTMLEGNKAAEISDTLKYMLCPTSEFTIFAIIVTIILAVFAGISVFRFSADKRTVNVYYSLGIRRTSLFTARYLAGATMLLAATVLPIVICAIVNSIYIGVNSYLVTAVIYFSLGLFVSAMLAYSVTAAVFSSVGTIIEGIVFSAGVLIIPTALIFAAQVFITSILYGAPYGDSYRLTDGTFVSGTDNSMLSSLSAYNPLFFFYNASKNFVSAGIKDGKVFAANEETLWKSPDFGMLFIWLAITAAVFVAGTYLFKAHKAENCGFIGTNKVLNAALTFTFGFFAFAICIYFLISKGILVGVLVGCAVFAVIYTALELFLTRSFKLYVKKLWKLPINLGICCLVAVIFATGGFGYSSKIPASSDIEKVSVSVPLNLSVAGVTSEAYGDYSDGARFIFHNSAILAPEMTDAQDIALVEKLHKSLIADERAENKVACDIIFNYTLKDGSVFSRRYKSCGQGTYTLFADYFDTKACETAITKTLTEKIPEKTYYLNMLNFSESSTLVAIGADYSTQNALELTEEQWNALKAALAKDLTGMSGSEYYFSGGRQLGILSFSQTPDEEVYGGQSIFISGAGSDYIRQMQYNMYASFNVVVTEGMKYTRNYLEGIGQKDCFTPTNKIAMVTFEPFRITVPKWLSEYYTPSPAFEARMVDSDRELITGFYGDNKQTDEAKIAEVLALSRLTAVSADLSGYRMFIYFEDGTAVSKFLSVSDAPDWLKSFTYPETVMFNDN